MLTTAQLEHFHSFLLHHAKLERLAVMIARSNVRIYQTMNEGGNPQITLVWPNDRTINPIELHELARELYPQEPPHGQAPVSQ